MMPGIVAGRLAFVTGAGSGIGRAACKLLAREGATVIAADRNLQAAQETIKTHIAIAAGNHDHSALDLDVSDSKSVSEALKKTMEVYRKAPCIIVNSAGITRDNWLLKMSEMDYESVLDVNLKGTFLVTQAFSRAMVDSKIPEGSIVNISSILGKYGNMGQTNYSASKAGVIGFTKSAAQELGKFNIRVNAVLPGLIDTPMAAAVPDKVRDIFIKQIPLGSLGQPADVAEVIIFLSSSKSRYVTGAAIDVTGGY